MPPKTTRRAGQGLRADHQQARVQRRVRRGLGPGQVQRPRRQAGAVNQELATKDRPAHYRKDTDGSSELHAAGRQGELATSSRSTCRRSTSAARRAGLDQIVGNMRGVVVQVEHGDAVNYLAELTAMGPYRFVAARMRDTHKVYVLQSRRSSRGCSCSSRWPRLRGRADALEPACTRSPRASRTRATSARSTQATPSRRCARRSSRRTSASSTTATRRTRSTAAST